MTSPFVIPRTLQQAHTEATVRAARTGRRHRVKVCTCSAWGGLTHFLVMSVGFDPGRWLP